MIEPKYPVDILDYPDPEDLANRVLDSDLSNFVQRHRNNEQPYIPTFLIEYHFQVDRGTARRAGMLLESHLDEDDLEEAIENR